ncbi:uncharacterized protein LOC134789233 [Penaeus indicus]|uniref:uncharacterized protein LOC134789233 n=1 Tax=Penaeus indicus TaxID=29960 RepID=UPI00300CC4D6
MVVLGCGTGPTCHQQAAIGPHWDDYKLDATSTTASTPKSRWSRTPAWGPFEVVNEPGGSILRLSDSEPCYDTTITARVALLDLPLHPHGTASSRRLTPSPTPTNHYTGTKCLEQGGGRKRRHLDSSVHAYEWGGSWSPNAPFTVNADDYA